MKKIFKTMSVCLMCLCFCITPVFLSGCGDKENFKTRTNVVVDNVEYSIFYIDEVLKNQSNTQYRITSEFTWDMEILVKNLGDEVFTTNTSLFKIVSNNDNFKFSNGRYHLTTTYITSQGEDVSLEAGEIKTIRFSGLEIFNERSYTNGQLEEAKNQCAQEFQSVLFSIYIGNILIGQFNCTTFFTGTQM